MKKTKKIILSSIIIITTLMIFQINASLGFTPYTPMTNYCQLPASIGGATVKPNLLLLLDYSGSMQFPAYLSCQNFSGYNNHNVAQCGTYTSGANYDHTKTYYGYFKSNYYYQYNNGNQFDINFSCTDTDKIGSSESCVSGNLLNWATATEVDVMRQVLTGGRTSIGTGDVIASGGSSITYTDSSLNCVIDIPAGTNMNQRTIKFTNKTGGTCPVGNWSAYKSIAIPASPNHLDSAIGIIQNTWSQITYEVMVFGDSQSVGQGKMLVSKGSTLSNTLSQITNENPYGGTPTGEALWEAYDYYKQSNDHNYESNTNDIHLGNGSVDPYFDGTGNNSSSVSCRKGFVLLITDGAWNGNVDPVVPAYIMNSTDLRSDLPGTQIVKTYTVYVFGSDTATTNSMEIISIFGGFIDPSGSNIGKWPYPFTGYNVSGSNSNLKDGYNNTTYSNSLSSSLSFPLAGCDITHVYSASCASWDQNGTTPTTPYNFYNVTDGADISAAIMSAINDMMTRSSSGSAVSILSSSQGSGANLLQAIYYPLKSFNSVQISWIGMLENLWYYLDPFSNNSAIFEDSTQDNILNLTNDNIIQFYFDSTQNQTIANLFIDSSQYGVAGSAATPASKSLETLNSLWEAGKMLWQRNISTSPRKIYAPITSNALTDTSNLFVSSNTNITTAMLNVPDATTLANVINYVNGTDISGYRNRTVTIGSSTNVWKLGDILNSTPRFVSWTPINNYAKGQPLGYADSTYSQFTSLSTYTQRGMAFAGGNDGMLHAFNMGYLCLSNDSNLCGTWQTDPKTMKAKLVPTTSGGSTADFGKEMWAYIPWGALPYLQYLTDPNYCHIYSVDGTPYIFDASIGIDSNVTQPTGCSSSNYWQCTKTKNSWRTILIGSMRLGGACSPSTSTCTNCVKTETDASGNDTYKGYSEYFALDITDPTTPSLLWSYHDTSLGFATTGPVIIRIASKKSAPSGDTAAQAAAFLASPAAADNTKNGRWFVVFGSGPTGPIDTTNHQFMGNSEQDLSLFIFDLALGPGAAQANVTKIDTGITNAFSGSINNASIDIVEHSNNQMDYQDEAFYLGYTQYNGTTVISGVTYPVWGGGVIRVLTNRDQNPANWIWSPVIQNIGPVTSAVAHLYDSTHGQLWLYFGEGRFFFRNSAYYDDPLTQRYIYGIVDPCFDSTTFAFKSACITTNGSTGSVGSVTISSLGQLNLSSTSGTTNTNGWYAAMAGPINTNGAERIVTDPLAAFTGSVYFTSLIPSTDLCSYGDLTYLWAFQYNSGASVASQQQGKALMQVSTGSVQNIQLSSAFTANGSRTTGAITGAPPVGQGLTVIIPPPPIKQILFKMKK